MGEGEAGEERITTQQMERVDSNINKMAVVGEEAGADLEEEELPGLMVGVYH